MAKDLKESPTLKPLLTSILPPYPFVEEWDMVSKQQSSCNKRFWLAMSHDEIQKSIYFKNARQHHYDGQDHAGGGGDNDDYDGNSEDDDNDDNEVGYYGDESNSTLVLNEEWAAKLKHTVQKLQQRKQNISKHNKRRRKRRNTRVIP